MKILLPLFSICLLALTACSFAHNNSEDTENARTLPDTLRVGTLYSPTSYFIYKSEEMGYEYEMISKFAADKGLQLKITVAHSMNAMLTLLDSGKIDIIAYEVPNIAEYKQRVIHCGNKNITHQVLVQPSGKKSQIISDVTGLVGKEVYVIKDSKYEARIKNLNNELGGGVKIHAIDKDSLIAEDLIDMVADKTIPLTIIDSDIARLDKTYNNNIDISLKVSLDQQSSWAVGKNNSWLADTINEWCLSSSNKATSKRLLKRYFELSKKTLGIDYRFDFKNGRISPYDNLFKQHAKSIGWDWRLLAAQAYTESHFDTTVVSWAGAKGLMQIMPRTAKSYGLGQDKIQNPELNIITATKIIADLDKSLRKKVPDDNERLLFIVAAYNSGLGHVFDAIELAKKHGKNPQLWHNNVRDAILLKANPEYYNDPVCRFGYFKGKQTVEYVAQVQKIYNLYKNKIKG